MIITFAMILHRCLLLTPFLLVMQNVCAQKGVSDSLYVAAAKANLKKHYYEERKSESLLYIGSDYADYEAVLDEHPFFLNDDWIFGDVQYNGIVYKNVPLQYDIHSQKLITEHAATGRRIELIQQKVAWFNLERHHFVFLSDLQTKGKIPQEYYELLVDGNTKLFASHSKTFQESTVTGKLEVRVEETKRYLVYKNAAFIPVKGKSTLMDALADKKASLGSEMRRRKISFNRDKHQAMIETVRIYNRLAQP